MVRILLAILVTGVVFVNCGAQTLPKKTLDHADFDSWNTIENPLIAHDGRWVVYEVQPGDGDGKLLVYDAIAGKEQLFPRGENAKISADSRFLVFKIKPFQDTVKAQRRRKVKKDDLPKDSLGILELATNKLIKVADVQTYQLPDQGNWLAYWKEPETSKADTAARKDAPKPKVKKESKENGSKLVFRNLGDGQETTVGFVKSYAHAKAGKTFLLASTGNDSTFAAGVYLFDATKNALQVVLNKKADYKNLVLDEKGTQAAFVADFDTTKAPVKPFELYFWKEGNAEAQRIADNAAAFLPKDWRVSENATLSFSKDASKLFFGIAPQPILQDTTLLDDEIVNVEVWSYTDPVMHTEQKVRLEREKKRSYDCVYHIADGKIVSLATLTIPNVNFGNEGNAAYALGYNDEAYSVARTWEGWNKRDVYLIDLQTGAPKLIAKGLDANVSFSPAAKYLYWYSGPDSAWFTYQIEKGTTQRISTNNTVKYYDELFDSPDYPNSYGLAGWLKEDDAMLVNDRYDIWKLDPMGKVAPQNLTNARKAQKATRYVNLDPEKRFIEPNSKVLLRIYEEPTKKSGYAWLDLANGTQVPLQFGEFFFGNRPLKAKNADRYVFTRENYQVFPDLLYSADLKTFKVISNANPQQKNYSWGNIELVEWTSLDGQKLQGLLAKPDNFDPKKKYPMIVNFYERSSDGLYQHRAPFPHRSQINYTFYTSRGYLVFNPDIPYRIGYPGESAFNAVIAGTTTLIDKGFVDKDRIALQGHSWGGYQIAYLLTRTNMFKCAEAGAPVVDMISAYGGIRWESGLSRAFQYEHTQSRIGGSIWQYPLRYLENSPIFTADKINTPVLILSNDKDGAVPWYQGIEFYTAMRRMNKPAWLLNYNDEPHWPLKPQNRKDFQKRLQQFFDHYLKDAPLPQWMNRGVPAMEKGIRQGYELINQGVSKNEKKE